MNYPNFDRLVAHLKTVNPARFNYMNPDPMRGSDAGCLACHAKALSLAATGPLCLRPADRVDIMEFLDVTHEEAMFLYGYGDVIGELAHDWSVAYATIRRQQQLEMGIPEALRRLALVSERYPREVVPDDAAFLDACRTIAAVPTDEAKHDAYVLKHETDALDARADGPSDVQLANFAAWVAQLKAAR